MTPAFNKILYAFAELACELSCCSREFETLITRLKWWQSVARTVLCYDTSCAVQARLGNPVAYTGSYPLYVGPGEYNVDPASDPAVLTPVKNGGLHRAFASGHSITDASATAVLKHTAVLRVSNQSWPIL